MTADALDLARRAVACPGWRWMPRMRAALGSVDTGDVAAVGSIGVAVVWDWELGAEWHDPDDLLPDLTDPATLGCLLALVREAWGDTGECGRVSVYATRSPTLHALGGNQPWAVCVSPPIIEGRVYHGPTEAAALVAALEAAP